jgi:hypothetical protein
MLPPCAVPSDTEGSFVRRCCDRQRLAQPGVTGEMITSNARGVSLDQESGPAGRCLYGQLRGRS